MDASLRQELALFLRSRREATEPAVAGVSYGGRRRTPGLRREEIAQLAGVSHTWYTWLEQARDISVTRPVVERLASALRLSPAERAHLFTLAGLILPPLPLERLKVDAVTRQLLDTLSPNPACVINLWWDVLEHNAAHAGLVERLDRRPPEERNNLWLLFMAPSVQALFSDWPAEVRPLLGQLRAHLAQFPDDPRGPELVSALQIASPKFAALWAEHNVRRFESARKVIEHPVGRLSFDYIKMSLSSDVRLSLLVYLPANQETTARLPSLAAGGEANAL